MAPIVLALMYVMGIIAWPTAKLLDYLLGEDHGTVYKKGGLKTLVSLHQSLGLEHERLNEDEVTIITAVLDLKAKAVGNIMTPMKDVFTMSSDTILDEKMMDNILSAGYSRIPTISSVCSWSRCSSPTTPRMLYVCAISLWLLFLRRVPRRAAWTFSTSSKRASPTWC
jgi:CBS domain containing-hemolysin-like protein